MIFNLNAFVPFSEWAYSEQFLEQQVLMIHLMPEREVKHLDVVGFEPRPVAWQESSLSIAPLPLGTRS